MLLLLACGPRTINVDRVEPSFAYVSLLSEDVGTQESPLPFSSEPLTMEVKVELLDLNGDPWDFEGDLQVKSRPGSVDGTPFLGVSGGVWEGEVSIYNGSHPSVPMSRGPSVSFRCKRVS